MKTAMRMMSIVLLAVLMLALVIVGCKKDEATAPTQPPGPVNTGTANFARYVSLGNSLTAGFQSNALSQRDQVWS